MASKPKVTVSLNEALVRELKGAGRKTRKPRSQLLGEALQLWRRSRLEQELRQGYQFMETEDRATAENHLAAGWEAARGRGD